MAGAEDFLRVDFYCEDGRLLFGEYCLYPPDRALTRSGPTRSIWRLARDGRRRGGLT